MTICYISGDLFETKDQVIGHGCNAKGVMGAGIAKIIKERYGYAFDAYKRGIEADMAYATNDDMRGSLLGQVYVGRFDAVPDSKIILNIITQLDHGNMPNWRFVSYDAIDVGFKRVAYMALINHWPAISIPKIGAGLGGGQWSIIEKIIEYNCKDFVVNIHTGDPG